MHCRVWEDSTLRQLPGSAQDPLTWHGSSSYGTSTPNGTAGYGSQQEPNLLELGLPPGTCNNRCISYNLPKSQKGQPETLKTSPARQPSLHSEGEQHMAMHCALTNGTGRPGERIY